VLWQRFLRSGSTRRGPFQRDDEDDSIVPKNKCTHEWGCCGNAVHHSPGNAPRWLTTAAAMKASPTSSSSLPAGSSAAVPHRTTFWVLFYVAGLG
jgi:hypothetical protein